MTTEQIVAIAITSISVTLLVYTDRTSRRLDKRLKRLHQVFEFRMYILNHHIEWYDDMPSFDHMMADDKPVTVESYLPGMLKKEGNLKVISR